MTCLEETSAIANALPYKKHKVVPVLLFYFQDKKYTTLGKRECNAAVYQLSKTSRKLIILLRGRYYIIMPFNVTHF